MWEAFRSTDQMLVLTLLTFHTFHPCKVLARVAIIATITIIHDMLALARGLTHDIHELFVITTLVTHRIGGRVAVLFVTQLAYRPRLAYYL